ASHALGHNALGTVRKDRAIGLQADPLRERPGDLLEQCKLNPEHAITCVRSSFVGNLLGWSERCSINDLARLDFWRSACRNLLRSVRFEYIHFDVSSLEGPRLQPRLT